MACNFCKLRNPRHLINEKDFDTNITATIRDRCDLELIFDAADSWYCRNTIIEINYCPMCGEKLEGLPDD